MADCPIDKVMINSEDNLKYTTPYGEIELQDDKLISFSHGLVGFNNCTVFGLAEHPAAKNTPILILQCVNEPSVSFSVVNSASLNYDYSEKDINEALKSADINADDACIMFILRILEKEDGTRVITANVKAPIILDVREKIARQVILNNKDLSTQFEI